MVWLSVFLVTLKQTDYIQNILKMNKSTGIWLIMPKKKEEKNHRNNENCKHKHSTVDSTGKESAICRTLDDRKFSGNKDVIL